MSNEKITILIKKIINRETIYYGISGVLTTIVNMATFYIFCYTLNINNLISNVIAWVLAVTFAFFMNAKLVFREQKSTLNKEIIKMFKFFLARGLSLGVEEVGLFIFANLIGIHDMLVKAGLAIVVIILNYVLSKLFIFNGK